MAECGYQNVKHIRSGLAVEAALPIFPGAVRGAFRLKSQAALAQLVEHIIRNDGVACSSHASGTTLSAPMSRSASGQQRFRNGVNYGKLLESACGAAARRRPLRALTLDPAFTLEFIPVRLGIGIAVSQIHDLDCGVQKRLREFLELSAGVAISQDGRQIVRHGRLDEPKMVAASCAVRCHVRRDPDTDDRRSNHTTA